MPAQGIRSPSATGCSRCSRMEPKGLLGTVRQGKRAVATLESSMYVPFHCEYLSSVPLSPFPRTPLHFPARPEDEFPVA
jgi:hypothetical protein